MPLRLVFLSDARAEVGRWGNLNNRADLFRLGWPFRPPAEPRRAPGPAHVFCAKISTASWNPATLRSPPEPTLSPLGEETTGGESTGGRFRGSLARFRGSLGHFRGLIPTALRSQPEPKDFWEPRRPTAFPQRANLETIHGRESTRQALHALPITGIAGKPPWVPAGDTEALPHLMSRESSAEFPGA